MTMLTAVQGQRLFSTLLVITIALTACTVKKQDITREQATVDYNLLLTLPDEPVSWQRSVKPVLEHRCIVCHGCYDAPCQLKLSSVEGIKRGASKVKVYDGARILGIEPTRLMIDAKTTQEWRNKGFHTVLNEGEATPRQNLEQSVFYQLLRLKQLHPQARIGMLSDDFLAFLPVNQRKAIRDSWYVGIRSNLETYLHAPSEWLKTEVVTGYQSDAPQTELYRHIERRLGPMAGPADYLNRCRPPLCQDPATGHTKQQADTAMAKVAAIEGSNLEVFPDLTFVRIRTGGEEKQDLAYTLIHNKAYMNISSMFTSEDDLELDDRRDLEHDTLSVVKGLQGAYPNFFFDIELSQVDDFAERIAAISSRTDYERFVGLFGVRRTRSDFWDTADWFQDHYAAQQPVLSGLFDLNRYRNR